MQEAETKPAAIRSVKEAAGFFCPYCKKKQSGRGKRYGCRIK
ncbi:hypothetical protein HMPREF1548_06171 [Clostridium sp. KLE 1755]|nr:hypothetical protein HMPREF1548_06171 [Clostridium sp. KLE 1755]